jgi:hypothetical protein
VLFHAAAPHAQTYSRILANLHQSSFSRGPYRARLSAGAPQWFYLGRRRVVDAKSHALRSERCLSALVRSPRLAAILSNHRHRLLDSVSTLGISSIRLSRRECRLARTERSAVLVRLAKARPARRLVRCGCFRSAPGHGGIGRVGHRNQKSSFDRIFPSGAFSPISTLKTWKHATCRVEGIGLFFLCSCLSVLCFPRA